MRKKILFIITKSEMGGASRFLFELTSRLSDEKYDILAAAGPDSTTQKPGELFQYLAEAGVKTAYLPRQSNQAGFKTIMAFIEIYKLISRFKPDALYLNSSEAGFLGGIAGSLYRFLPHPFSNGGGRKKIKIIYRIGGWAFKEPRNIIVKKIYLWAEKISAPFKDIIVVNSEFDRRLAIKHKIVSPEKIVVIRNGVDLKNLNFLPKEEAKKILASKTKNRELKNLPMLGAIALFYKNKGLSYLVSAMAPLKGKAQLAIIGDGEERTEIENLIKKLNLGDSVFLTGYIPEAYKYLKAFDIFVLPSVKEGQPWAVLEAMAAETPIVATNIAGVPEMIENEISGLLVEPADSEALSKTIEKAITRPSLTHEMAQNALIAVKEKFGIEEMIEKNEELF